MIFPGQTGIICWKALSRAIIPEKMSKFWGAVQKILNMGDFRDFGSFKKIFSKKFFFRLRIVQFVWKTCFYDFRFFLLRNFPRLSHFSTKKWNLRFWPRVAIFSKYVHIKGLLVEVFICDSSEHTNRIPMIDWIKRHGKRRRCISFRFGKSF